MVSSSTYLFNSAIEPAVLMSGCHYVDGLTNEMYKTLVRHENERRKALQFDGERSFQFLYRELSPDTKQ
jgi:hypothetical protein